MITQETFCGIVPAVNQNLRAYGMVSLWFFKCVMMPTIIFCLTFVRIFTYNNVLHNRHPFFDTMSMIIYFV